MEPTFMDRSAFAVAGVLARGAPEALDYGAIWGRFDPYVERLRPLSLDGAFYAAYYPGEQPGTVELIAGMAVAGENVPVPEGLVVRAVPASHYAVFQCTIGTIGQTYGRIYGGWRPPAGMQVDHTRPDLEIYPPDSTGGPDVPCVIHVPLMSAPDERS